MGSEIILAGGREGSVLWGVQGADFERRDRGMTDALDDLRRMTRAAEWERRALEAEEHLKVAEANLDGLRKRVKVLEGERDALRVALMAARR